MVLFDLSIYTIKVSEENSMSLDLILLLLTGSTGVQTQDVQIGTR